MIVTSKDITYRDLFGREWVPDGKTSDEIAVPAMTTANVVTAGETRSTVIFVGIKELPSPLTIRNQFLMEL